MGSSQLIEEYENKLMQKRPKFEVGDTIRVHTKIIEGEKERIQIFTGIVIAKKGSGLSETFTLYRTAYGCSMERDFLLNSPRITKIEIERTGKVRKAKLYYLKGATGKKARVKEQIGGRKQAASTNATKETVEEQKQEPEKTEVKKEEKPKTEKKKPAPKKKKEDNPKEDK